MTAPTPRSPARRIVRRGLRSVAWGWSGWLGCMFWRWGSRRSRRGRAWPRRSSICTCRLRGARCWPSPWWDSPSVLYLWLEDPRLDRFAAASANAGVVFSAVMLTTGPIWAKPIWGTWWTWDARLTLTLFLFFLFLGYLALRAAIHDPAERARFSAVVGILGMLLVPFIHLSVYLFRTLHPQPIVLKPSAPSLPPEMLRTLLISTCRVHGAVSGFRDDALRAGAGGGATGGGARCLPEPPRMAGTWSPPT